MTRGIIIEAQRTRSIVGAFYEVYNTLGFGFLEHVYVMALERELRQRGHEVIREHGVPVLYKGTEVAYQRLDIVVDQRIVVETKSTYDLHPAAKRQLFNYLRATSFEVGLLFHFGPEPRFYRAYAGNPSDSSAPSAASG